MEIAARSAGSTSLLTAHPPRGKTLTLPVSTLVAEMNSSNAVQARTLAKSMLSSTRSRSGLAVMGLRAKASLRTLKYCVP
jgi:hypothetical protein